tara:strand:- start:1980 stop:3434 length:1455 start_codon:yes stop_codon:yes gene_type:complete
MENKVKFHALERLDLVDVNALQDNMYTYMAKAFGNLIGGISGLLTIPNKSNISISSPNIVFPDFIYIESHIDVDYTGSLENRMIAFDASLPNNGDLNYASALQAVQTYYGSNNALPDGPRTSGFNPSNNTLFPYIWVRKSEFATTLDNRRFWDTSDDTETTNPVDTRFKYAVEFTLNHTTPAGGYTKIGRIIDWDVNNDVVELPSASQSIELYTFADDVYFTDGDFTLDSSSGFASLLFEGGLRTALRTIRKQIVDIRGNGSADAGIPSTSTSPFNGLPYLSLDALYQRGSNLEERLNSNKKGSVIFTLISDPANDSHTIETDFYINANDGSTLSSGISAYYDYEFLHTLPSTTAISSWDADRWSLANSVLAIDFGDTYSGYGIRMSVDVVNALALKEDAPNHFMRPIHAQPFSDDITSSANYNDIFKVSSNTYQNLSDTSTAFKGIKVSLSGVYDYFNDEYDSSPFTTVVRIPVKIDFELIKP